MKGFLIKTKWLRKYLFFILFFFIFSVHSFAQFENVKKTILENGLTVITKPQHNLPIVTVDMWVNTGSINETDQNNGISHFVEHLLFKSTKKRKSEEIYREIEAVGGKINAATSYDFTHFYITVPAEEIKLALDMISDMVFNPQFLDDEIEQERKVVIEEIRRKKDHPYRVLDEIFRRTFYEISPYKRPILGSEEILKRITREEIINYYNTYYIPSNMVLVIVGSFDEQKLMEGIKEFFGKEKFTFPILKEYEEDKPLTEVKKVVKSYEVSHTYFILGYPAPPIKEREDVYTMDIILMLLGEGRSSRLYQRLKEEKELVIEISTEFLTQKKKGIFAIVGKCNPENIDRVKEEILQEIEKIKNVEVKNDELDKAKNLLEAQVVFDIETTSGLSSYFGFYETLDDLDFALSYLDEIRKVNQKQIKKVATKYFTKDYVFCVLTPAKR